MANGMKMYRWVRLKGMAATTSDSHFTVNGSSRGWSYYHPVSTVRNTGLGESVEIYFCKRGLEPNIIV